jgi:hypothetical protein
VAVAPVGWADELLRERDDAASVFCRTLGEPEDPLPDGGDVTTAPPETCTSPSRGSWLAVVPDADPDGLSACCSYGLGARVDVVSSPALAVDTTEEPVADEVT